MKVSEIPKKRLSDLNRGIVSTTNLTEWLAVDQSLLLSAVAENSNLPQLEKMRAQLPKVSVPQQISWIGKKLVEFSKWEQLDSHPSDIVQCWACYGRAGQAKGLKSALMAVKPFAESPHFGIREVAWMAVRDLICEQPEESIELLIPWAKNKSEYVRRFSTEATRPRGVWAKHIKAFRENPAPARPLLDLLHSDPSKYVQDSVGNWLNDAGKDHPAWVKKVVGDWKKKSTSPATKYIVKRAMRSL